MRDRGTELWLPAELPLDAAAADSVLAGSTTRFGGVSRGRYAERNLALHVGDDPDRVDANRAALEQQLGCLRIQWLNQVHGNRVVYADRRAAAGEPPCADGCWTDRPGIALAIMTADCVPVLLAGRQGGAIGAVHAGWQGLAGNVIGAVVDAMPGPANDLSAWVGPCISAVNYETGADVWQRFERGYAGAVLEHPTDPAKRLLDLAQIARMQLLARGVQGVSMSGICSFDDDRFYSHRRAVAAQQMAGAQTGRFATLVMLNR